MNIILSKRFLELLSDDLSVEINGTFVFNNNYDSIAEFDSLKRSDVVWSMPWDQGFSYEVKFKDLESLKLSPDETTWSLTVDEDDIKVIFMETKPIKTVL